LPRTFTKLDVNTGPRVPARLLLPRIVHWVHVVDILGAYTMNLDNSFFASPEVVIGLGWGDYGAAGG
jgi:hypothetical protein